MRCENDFCIYWNDNKCILEEITINNAGICDDCILVNIEEDILKQKREETLNKYNSD